MNDANPIHQSPKGSCPNAPPPQQETTMKPCTFTDAKGLRNPLAGRKRCESSGFIRRPIARVVPVVGGVMRWSFPTGCMTRIIRDEDVLVAHASPAPGPGDPEPNTETEKNPLDFPQEWMKANPSRRPDIFPEFEPMKPPLPQPLPGDPEEPEEEEEEEEEKEDPEEEPEEEPKPEEE